MKLLIIMLLLLFAMAGILAGIVNYQTHPSYLHPMFGQPDLPYRCMVDAYQDYYEWNYQKHKWDRVYPRWSWLQRLQQSATEDRWEASIVLYMEFIPDNRWSVTIDGITYTDCFGSYGNGYVHYESDGKTGKTIKRFGSDTTWYDDLGISFDDAKAEHAYYKMFYMLKGKK